MLTEATKNTFCFQSLCILCKKKKQLPLIVWKDLLYLRRTTQSKFSLELETHQQQHCTESQVPSWIFFSWQAENL